MEGLPTSYRQLDLKFLAAQYILQKKMLRKSRPRVINCAAVLLLERTIGEQNK